MAKLPPFQIAASTPPATQHPPAPSRLDPADVSLLSVYARVYCAYLDRPARRLLLYRFYKCAAVPLELSSVVLCVGTCAQACMLLWQDAG